MGCFKDLPEEVVNKVCSFIYRHRDFASLSCVSRVLNSAVATSLAYVRLNETMEMPLLRFEDPRSRLYQVEPREDALSFYVSFLRFKLVSVLIRPEPALAVKSVEFVRYLLQQDRGDLVTWNVLESTFKCTGLLEWQGGKDLLLALQAGNLEAHLAVLLLALKNLEDLIVPIPLRDKWLLWAIGKAVTTDFIPRALSSGFNSVRIVHLVWLPPARVNMADRDRRCLSLDTLSAVFLLPSIDKISLSYFDPARNDGDFKWEWAYGSSTLTQLKLIHCCITGKELEVMLSFPKKLRAFHALYVPNPYEPELIEIAGDGVGSKDLKSFTDRQLINLVKSKDVHNSLKEIYVTTCLTESDVLN